MTPKQIELVQESFAMIAPKADEVASLFYERLFTLDPSVRPLFRGDLKHQGKKLMATLALVASGLDRREQIVMALRHLGERHAGYGVQAQDYETVRAALLGALAQALDDAFTGEVEAAWNAAYTFITGLMLEAAAEVACVQGL